MSRGKILIISAPSGTGKGTIANNILQKCNSMKYSTSATTRSQRPGDIPGESYFFKTNEEFDEMIKTGEILEWDEFCGNRYGTPKTPLLQAIENGKDILLDITVEGAMAVKKAFPDDSITVFIKPPSIEELERRLRGRGSESEEAIQKRLKTAKEEMKTQDMFEYVVVNDSLEKATDELIKILENAKKKGYND